MSLQTWISRWQQWQVNHPALAHVVVVAESAAVGAAVDLCANGVDVSEQGLKHAATIIGTAVVMAVRNYLKTNAKNLRSRLAAQSPESR